MEYAKAICQATTHAANRRGIKFFSNNGRCGSRQTHHPPILEPPLPYYVTVSNGHFRLAVHTLSNHLSRSQSHAA